MNSDFETITIGNTEYALGLLPTPTHLRACFDPKTIKNIPETEWKPISSRAIFGKSKNQKTQGSCVGASGVKIISMTVKRQTDRDVDLSIASLYGQINNGRDAGASLGDAYLALQKVGCCTTATIGDYEWQSARRNNTWHEEAKSYRMDEGVLCQSVEEFFTWLQLGFIGQMGLQASGLRPDANGFCAGSRGRIDHALGACGMLKDNSGRWWIEGFNSWGEDWGPLGGMFYYPIDKLPMDELWIARTTIVT